MKDEKPKKNDTSPQDLQNALDRIVQVSEAKFRRVGLDFSKLEKGRLSQAEAGFSSPKLQMRWIDFWAMQVFINAERLSSKLTAISPEKAEIADTLFIFACGSPDEAEVVTGDLMENFSKVAKRRSAAVSEAYFWWELSLLVISKAKKRLIGATIGPLLKKFLGS